MKLAIYFNSPSLGGAERSMVHQIALMPKNWKISVFVPYLEVVSEITELDAFLRKTLFATFPFIEIIPLQYPAALYSQSRFGSQAKLFEVGLDLLHFQLHLRHFNLQQYDAHWCNGNKIGLPLFLFLEKEKCRRPFVWHFRDYPESRFPYSAIWKLFAHTRLPLFLVGNSDSVCSVLKTIKGRGQIFRLYNPAGESLKFRPWDGNKKNFKMGLVSMLAPWKGLHIAIQYHQWLAKELSTLGVKEVCIYGANIYRTKGEHDNYAHSLRDLLDKFTHETCRFEFITNASPPEIFSNIDILFHSSLRPEPFGRVILEAYMSGVPVISFSEGGAAELVNFGGYPILKHHPFAYYSVIKDIIENGDRTSCKIEQARARGEEINTYAKSDMEKLIRNF